MQNRKATVVGVILCAGSAVALSAWAAQTRPAATRPAATQPTTTRAATTQPSNTVVIETTRGRIVVELTPDRTPITVENFLQYVDEKFYDGTVFHRVIPGFMIQGGGYTVNLDEKGTRDPIKNESQKGLSNQRGTIAMARKPHPDSATAQFFINVADNRRLDRYGGGYTAFGRVIEGMDVVDAIVSAPTSNKSPVFSNLPTETVEIRSIRRK